MTCPYADNYKNKEGWLVTSSGELVCLDWDDFCVKCRVGDSKDFVFNVVSNNSESTRKKTP